jgi:hypothetical protein
VKRHGFHGSPGSHGTHEYFRHGVLSAGKLLLVSDIGKDGWMKVSIAGMTESRHDHPIFLRDLLRINGLGQN